MRIKPSIRRAINRSASAVGMLAACERRMRQGLTILTYHRVLPDNQWKAYPLRSLAVPESAFRAQVAWMREHCDVRPVAEAIEALTRIPNANGARAKPLVAMTFDDGYRDNAVVAAPIMEAAGVRGTFFLTVGLVLDSGQLWFDSAAMAWQQLDGGMRARLEQSHFGVRAPEFDTVTAYLQWLKVQPNNARAAFAESVRVLESMAGAPLYDTALMSPAEARTLAARGHEIGSHSLTHPLLLQLSPTAQRGEIAASRSRLRDALGVEAVGFCYPNGDFDDRIAELVRESGYRYACTTRHGFNLPEADLMQFRRIDMNPRRWLTDECSVELELASFRAELSLLHVEMWSWLRIA